MNQALNEFISIEMIKNKILNKTINFLTFFYMKRERVFKQYKITI